ncbi:MAG TPA: HDIG domain-containing protein [Deltaproteobacteria bacterium]|nr:HDIG domain-containing protein [Deltaproteobacteria bacterium]
MPSRKQAIDLIRKKEMPHHIFRHSMAVRKVAVAVACLLKAKGHAIDVRLVDRAAMLHDICKIDSIRNGGDHALMGEHLLRECGYPMVADVVGQHVRLKSFQLNEAMVVNYADKRVKHDRIVSLSERFIDLMNRYGTDDARQERILKHYLDVVEIEHSIMSSCDIDDRWLENLDLIPGDYPLYCCECLLRENSTVENHDEDIDLEGVYQDEPVLVDK